MYVIFVSNCSHQALTRTRAVLDRYAQRLGDRTWGTKITLAALEEVHLALRRQASRNNSIACYREDSLHGMRLDWVVGSHAGYDRYGRFVVATREHPLVLPLAFQHAKMIAEMAGYAHDLGKASERFQEKLEVSCHKGKAAAKAPSTMSDYVRHEWLSAKLMEYMLQDDKVTLTRKGLSQAWQWLSGCNDQGSGDKRDLRKPPVKEKMTTGLDAMLWAVCTHHGAIGGTINETPATSVISSERHIPGKGNLLPNIKLCRPDTLTTENRPLDTKRWDSLFANLEALRTKIVDVGTRESDYWEGVMLIARAALILADHKVSSELLPDSEAREDGVVFANTKARTSPAANRAKARRAHNTGTPRFCDQPLSWHLTEVGRNSANNMQMFVDRHLPHVNEELVQRILTNRSDDPWYTWQDKAADLVGRGPGGLVFDVAATGAGKTFGNLKIALAMHPKQARLAVAFNLRSLTTQTFAAFGKLIRESDTLSGEAGLRANLACLIGDSAGKPVDFSLEDEDDIDVEDNINIDGLDKYQIPEWLDNIATNGVGGQKLAKLIAAPILVSTMDWIVAAGEPGQQARHAKALIRVANSDLILDEVDSYDVKASVAVMRVIQTAASLGRNVVVSSATLNPELARNICLAYAAGRRVADAMFGQKPWGLTVVGDSFAPQVFPHKDDQDARTFADTAKDNYVKTMSDAAKSARTSGMTITKRYRIATVSSVETKKSDGNYSPIREGYYSTITEEAIRLHNENAITLPGKEWENCRLSIGFVRVPNVYRCAEVAEHLRSDPQGRFLVTAYHAHDLAERRAWKEKWLDKILFRTGDKWIEALKKTLPQGSTSQPGGRELCLVVVATPVEEVGRDHDFDWAIIEASSMHSIIQAAGRVNRHRQRALPEGTNNVCLLSRNYRALDGSVVAFEKPGLEVKYEVISEEVPLTFPTTHHSHDLRNLMTPATTASALLNEDGDTVTTGVLDAGLVFDPYRKTLFTEYDEESTALQTSLVTKAIARDSGYEAHFMVDIFATKFPLRDHTRRKTYLITPPVPNNLAGPVVGRFITDNQGGTFEDNQRPSQSCNKVFFGEKTADSISPERAWLSPTLEELSRRVGDKDCLLHLTVAGAKVPVVERIKVEWNNVVTDDSSQKTK